MAADINIRRNDDLLCGRLVAMPTVSMQQTVAQIMQGQGSSNLISVDFPAMPDTIEFARSADYTVHSSPNLPDGIHVYKGTKPMEIPILFNLHFMDDTYCKQGALTLLQLAGRLHSFLLPVHSYSSTISVAAVAGPFLPLTAGNGTPVATGKPTEFAQLALAAQASSAQPAPIGSATTGLLSAPVTCWLHLMWVGQDQPGVSCVGYVKDVKVVLKGPWLRGVNSSFNLPTSAEYSFVFMHVPSYANTYLTDTDPSPALIALSESSQAFADDVKAAFYNTQRLVGASNYQGYATGDTTQS